MDILISFIEGDVTGIAFLLFIFVIFPMFLCVVKLISAIYKKYIDNERIKKKKALKNAYKTVARDLRKKENRLNYAMWVAMAIAYEEYKDYEKRCD